MTYDNVQAPQATCWNIQEAFVTHKGSEYRFWAEHELLQNEYTYGFYDEARGIAIDWQNWQAEHSMSWLLASEWQSYFERLAEKFNLTDEFKENGILWIAN